MDSWTLSYQLPVYDPRVYIGVINIYYYIIYIINRRHVDSLMLFGLSQSFTTYS